jgi:hypothetical protein
MSLVFWKFVHVYQILALDHHHHQQQQQQLHHQLIEDGSNRVYFARLQQAYAGGL